ncbi:60S ribosomal protein L28-like [Leopardus geoffroyi]|uniref:60S ribosomal protein L28-like n=1 Tax=Leopardus geoffroyi TaxID=46844 RepID=UPI001E26531C|nr:60S ribosomal protein L28-like [Leopardus geoffroyi]
MLGPSQSLNVSLKINSSFCLWPLVLSTCSGWMVVQNCSSFLIKRNKQTHNTELNNLKARNYCYSGLIHHKTVSVELVADGKGVVVAMKGKSSQQKPATSSLWPVTKKTAQGTLSSIRHMIYKNKPEMVKREQVALSRAPECLPPNSKAIKMSAT